MRGNIFVTRTAKALVVELESHGESWWGRKRHRKTTPLVWALGCDRGCCHWVLIDVASLPRRHWDNGDKVSSDFWSDSIGSPAKGHLDWRQWTQKICSALGTVATRHQSLWWTLDPVKAQEGQGRRRTRRDAPFRLVLIKECPLYAH